MDTTQQAVAAPATTSRSSGRVGVILREPFRADTWRRTAYVVLALPVGLLCVPLALAGGPAARVQRGLARRLLGPERPESRGPLDAQVPLEAAQGLPGTDAPARTATPRTATPRTGALALAHAVISVPLNLVAATVTLYFWMGVAINLGFPLRPDNDLAASWGGPTLAGAWAVHAIGGGVTFLFLTPWVVKGFTGLQARLISGFLGADRSGLRRSMGLAIGVAAVCALLSIPVIHQL